MIHLVNISKTYHQPKEQVHAVREVSLDVEKGDVLGIVGTSGAGKSTILNCINLLERPDKGEVWVDGVDLMTLTEKQVEKKRKETGMIFQHFNLFSQRNVLENVIYPIKGRGLSKNEILNRGRELLHLVGILDKETAYPNQLSGGQKQRVAIARALSSNPKILLCDEATSALDPQTTTAILKLLADINQKLGITIVLITHEKAVVKQICTKVALMENGELIETNDTVSFFVKPQQEVTKRFVGGSVERHEEKDKIFAYLESLKTPKSLLRQLTYLNANTGEAFVSIASKKFNVDIAILFGNIEFIANQIIGNLVVNISGDENECQKALKFFEQSEIMVREVKLDA